MGTLRKRFSGECADCGKTVSTVVSRTTRQNCKKNFPNQVRIRCRACETITPTRRPDSETPAV